MPREYQPPRVIPSSSGQQQKQLVELIDVADDEEEVFISEGEFNSI